MQNLGYVNKLWGSKISLHEKYMQMALLEAEKAATQGEVPVGAILVVDNKVIAKAYNQSIKLNDPTAHAELLAIRCATRKLGNYRLPPESVLYVTVEPCLMCTGALIWARVSELVYGTKEPKFGVCGSVLDLFKNGKFSYRIKVTGGILSASCRELIQTFFHSRR